jgi:hypothetical protein
MIVRKKSHIRNLTMMSVSLVLMGFMAMWVLTGCAMFEDRFNPEFRIEPADDPLCCIPDQDFPHSCDGWLLCDTTIQLKEAEE